MKSSKSTPVITAIKHTYHAQKNRVISFFNKGKSISQGLPFSFFMVYVMNEIQFQVVLMARDLYFLGFRS